jgi:hypothetical protein
MTASEKANKAASTLETPCGVRIHRIERAECYADAVLALQSSLDSRRGVRLTSSFEHPGRYTRWDLGFVDPPLVFTTRGRAFNFDALNARGALLLAPIGTALENLDAVATLDESDSNIRGTLRESDKWFPEELRSKQPTGRFVLASIKRPAPRRCGSIKTRARTPCGRPAGCRTGLDRYANAGYSSCGSQTSRY